MKKTLVIGTLLAGATGVFAQGSVNGTVKFSDLQSTFEIHIYAPQLADPSVQVTGNAANDRPAGTQTGYTGGVVGGSATGTGLGNGNDVSVELFALGGGTSAAPLSSLIGVSQYTTTVYTTAGFAGQFLSVSPAGDPGIPNSSSGSATVALAAWYNGGGAYTSLSAAQAAGQPAGESNPIFLNGSLGGVIGSGGTPNLPPALTGITSFSLTTSTPEPSTIALGVMGASAFLLRRRMSK
jgi:hypothetical protein